MSTPLPLAAAAITTVLFGVFGIAAVLSFREGERRATTVSAVAAVLAGGLLVAVAVLGSPVSTIVLAAVGVSGAAILLRCAIPLRRPVVPGGRPAERVDERDIMFARARLRSGTPEYESYYRRRPEHRASDDRTRELPGLLSADAELADPIDFAAADACFRVTEALRHEVDGPVADSRDERASEEWARDVKRLALGWGAVTVGVTELDPTHIYTHIGRGTGVWGDEITLDHRWAIAFTVEMDHRAVAQAPRAPVVAESARQYVESAKIAIQLASVIRDRGWPARAHIDGNYRVVAPLVARDAGLGEIGRMGLLMTPRLGPRVRLGVVTTDLPLIADPPGDDATVLDFCAICEKCAVNCPVGAIPYGDRTPIAEGLRWQIDDDSCFRYWNLVGTDCASCMKVCPYSHPDNPMHTVVRKLIRLSPGTRNLMLWADDVVYGRKPQHPLGRER